MNNLIAMTTNIVKYIQNSTTISTLAINSKVFKILNKTTICSIFNTISASRMYYLDGGLKSPNKINLFLFFIDSWQISWSDNKQTTK